MERKIEIELDVLISIIKVMLSGPAVPTTHPLISLRNYSAHNFKIPFCRTTTYLYSFFPTVIKLWNTLPNDIKQSNSISLLKQFLDNHTYEPIP